MASDYIALGSAPLNEEGVQVRSGTDYAPEMIAECDRFRAMLIKKFGHLYGINFKVHKFLHDFGPYYEVIVVFAAEDEEAVDNADFVERNLPEYW